MFCVRFALLGVTCSRQPRVNLHDFRLTSFLDSVSGFPIGKRANRDGRGANINKLCCSGPTFPFLFGLSVVSR